MGVNITDLLSRNEISLNELSGKVIAVDASLFLYQFITTIRGRDGALLMDSKGAVTSHLVGLFARTTNLMQKNLKLVYVFDGVAPELKQKEREKRKNLKILAQKKYEEAVKSKDVEDMKKYAARTSRLDKNMIQEAKDLLIALGIPIVQAPSEGEAQASYMAKTDSAYAVASQDADSLLFGTPKLIRNLSLLGKRKKTNKLSYETIKPEIVDLAENLNNLGIDQNGLIALSMLVGTDYNPGGIKGIGPKNAIKLVNKYGTDLDSLFKEVKWDDYFEFPWTEVYYLIKKIPTTDDYSLTWNNVDSEKLMKLLVDKHDFSEERVKGSISKLIIEKEKKSQKSLFDF